MSTDPSSLRPGERRRLERYFLHHGLPHLTAGYDPRTDTLTRMRAPLVLLLLVGLVFVLRPDWPWALRVPAVLAGIAVAVGIFVLVNFLRSRPLLDRPQRVGFPEVAVLVLAPPVAAATLGGGGRFVLGLAIATSGIALFLYALMSFGVLSLFLHQWRRARDGLAASGSVAIRAMPPVLAVLLFLSLSQETWQAFGDLEGWRYGGVVIAFGLLVVLILVVGLSRERSQLLTPRPDDVLSERALRTPAAALVNRHVAPSAPPLGRLERLNVGLALLLTLFTRVVAVAVAVGAFFLIFGFLVVDRELSLRWVSDDPNLLTAATIAGREVVLTEAHFRVAGILGAFGALYFAAVALGDPRHREKFLDDELDRLSGVMAAWAFYRGALAGTRRSGPSPQTAGES